ncbi:hypothetical protein KDA23_01205 [Candidatus Saccharibacteria bacterium]|nr:hypothetical protein [Candidatus Saccharibacteria bacterium]
MPLAYPPVVKQARPASPEVVVIDNYRAGTAPHAEPVIWQVDARPAP